MSISGLLIWVATLVAVLLVAYALLPPGGKKVLQGVGIALAIAAFFGVLLIVGVLALVSFVLFGLGHVLLFLGDKGSKLFPVLFATMWEEGLACVPGLGKKKG